MGKQVLFHAGKKNQRKLQTLCRVQRHQLNAVLVLVRLGVTRIQRRAVQELLQGGQLFFIDHKLLGSADQFFEVLHPGLALFPLLLLEELYQPRALDNVFHQLFQQHFVGTGIQLIDKRDKPVQGTQRSCRQQLFLDHHSDRLPQRYLTATCTVAHNIHGFTTNPPRWRVDHPLHRRIIPAAEQQT